MLAGALQLPAPRHPLFLSPTAAILLVSVVAGGCWVFARRNHEDVFLLALGYARVRLLATFLLPPLLLELALGVLVRA